jgi:uncharacterized repeat protein (TIGR01451 family)
MRRFNLLLITGVIMLFIQPVWATGEPSTYFNIYVPPNNDAVQRNVCLIVTAIFDSTSFTITDDAMDGDSDDTKSGILMAGQSYILYIKDNGINDDALYASGGTLRRDGDYFIIESDKNVYASQSTNSDWQHDWVPGVSQSGLSTKFIVYSPKGTSSKRDINAMAYEDSTIVSLRKISLSSTIVTGYTNVDYQSGTIIFQRRINRGEDLIHFYNDARNILDDGHTYVIESNKPITLQYGALYGNERDGGGYVPTNTGSSSGELAYFVVPYQAVGEQEIRVVSWDADNNVVLYRYNAGAWVEVKNWNMGARTVQEWVGKNNGNVSYATVWKLVCTPGKRFSVFEGNWFETGSVGTSDMATMVSAENGTTSGTYFLTYMAPPGNQANCINPFTNTLFGGKYTHLYLFAQDSANVIVKDAYTNGVDYSATFSISGGRYADCALSEAQWKSIYNGTGTIAGGPERPYLIVESDAPISVMNTNFNDNWMMYFGSSQFQAFSQSTSSTHSVIIPGQHITITSDVEINGTTPITNVTAKVLVEGGLEIVSSVFVDVSNGITYNGTIGQSGNMAIAEFSDLPNLSPTGEYQIVSILNGSVMDVNGNPIIQNSVSEVTTIINGQSNARNQQSIGIESVASDVYDTRNLIFDYTENTGLESMLTDSWTVSTIDYDGDGDDDLFFTDRTATQSNKLYRNNGNGTYTQITTGALVTDQAKSITSSWADVDNDGDLDVVVANNTFKSNFYYLNNGNGTFTKNTSVGFVQDVGYYHHASWVDVDNDGQLELFLGNYWPTKFNELWKLDTEGNWVLWQDNLLSQITGSGVGATWSDIDNDGFQDLLLLNNAGGNNRMFRNLGDGNFEEIVNDVTADGGDSVASTWGDVDNDGDLDLFVSNTSNMNNDFYINNGDGTFTKVTSGPLVSMGGHSHGAAFADIDQDGDLDLFVSNDQGVKFLYLNDGNGNFSVKDDEWPNANFGKGFGFAWSDLDLDGDVDMVNATHSNQRNFIFTANDDYNNNNWLTIRLTGTNSNRSAIGARVRIYANGEWQMRELNSQNGLGGQNSLRQSFGLGSASVVDSVVVIWPSGYRQTLTNINPNQHMSIVEDTGALVQAQLFFDENNNCIKDNDEIYLSGVQMAFDSGDYSVISNESGFISTYMELGNHSLQLQDDRYSGSCQLPVDFSVNTLGVTQSLGNLAVQPICTNHDLVLTAMTTVMRRGFSSYYFLEVTNQGVGTANNVQLSTAIPSEIMIDSASVDMSQMNISGGMNQITWNLGSMEMGHSRSIRLYYKVGLDLLPGDLVTNSFEVTASGLDCDGASNVVMDMQEIFGSFDPNDIAVYPIGFTDQHYIEQHDELTYRIRFQNIGNYPADFVTIVDTMPSGLLAHSIHHITSSHVYSVSVSGQIITFRFDQIHLPDSASDALGSNGFIQFTLKQSSGNSGGEILRNAASIQFDYNEFIHTNRVWNTVMADHSPLTDGTLVVFPNPVVGHTLLKAKTSDGSLPALRQIVVYDVVGKKVHIEYTELQVPEINLGHLIAGQYMIVATDYLGRKYKGIAMVTN